jgi:hypothetical protein
LKGGKGGKERKKEGKGLNEEERKEKQKMKWKRIAKRMLNFYSPDAEFQNVTPAV